MLYSIGNEPKIIDKHPTTGNKQGQIIPFIRNIRRTYELWP